MNRHTALATFVATLGATLALVSTTAVAGRTPPPPDPCATASPDYATNWEGFPAYAYTVFDSKTYTTQVRVASRNGVCSKRVGPVLSGRAGSTSFAKAPDTSYVIAFSGGGGAMLATFALDGVGETTTYIPATFVTFRSDTTGTLDLAPDGTHLAYERTPAYGTYQLFVASLSDPVGGNDSLVQSFNNGDSSYLWWAPWGRIYYTETNAVTGKRLQSVNPWDDSQTPVQTPVTILQISGNAPLVVNQLFAFAQISGGYVGDTPYIVFQGEYTTGIRLRNGSQIGSWCAAAYAIDGNTTLFLIGSIDNPSPITGFYPSVTGKGTVLYEKSTAPTSGSTCTRTGYVGEMALKTGYTPSISGQAPGSWPAALKTP